MLRIHRPIACLIGAIILLVSVFFFQTSDYEAMLSLMTYGNQGILGHYLDTKIQPSDLGFLEGLWGILQNAQMQKALSSVGMVLGILTILYGLIPDKQKNRYES